MNLKENKYPTVIWSIIPISIGIYIRIYQWSQSRSLFLDEANLARNIFEKSGTDFFAPLSYGQYSPPLFSLLTKFVCTLAGYSEMALRFIPLLCGILGIIILWKIIKNELGEISIFMTLMLAATSIVLWRYGTEFKQYSLDFFITLMLIHHFFISKYKEGKHSRSIFLGVTMIWLSMPSVFILSSIGITKFIWSKKKQERIFIIKMSLFWMCSFVIYYSLILKSDIGTDYITSAHQNYFPSFSNLMLNLTIIKEWIGSFLGYKTIQYAFFLITFFVGVVSLYLRNKKLLFALGLSLILVVIAGTFKVYTLRPRLLIFTHGLLYIIMAYGLDALIGNKFMKWIIVTITVVCISISTNWKAFYSEYEITDYKEELKIINELPENTSIYTNTSAWPSYHYYQKIYKKPYAKLIEAKVIRFNESSSGENNYLLLGPTWSNEEEVFDRLLKQRYVAKSITTGNTLLLKIDSL